MVPKSMYEYDYTNSIKSGKCLQIQNCIIDPHCRFLKKLFGAIGIRTRNLLLIDCCEVSDSDLTIPLRVRPAVSLAECISIHWLLKLSVNTASFFPFVFFSFELYLLLPSCYLIFFVNTYNIHYSQHVTLQLFTD